MPKPVAQKPKKKEPFRVFEAGIGVFPTAFIRKAAQSEARGKNREFIGVDLKLAPKPLALLAAGKLKMPGVLELRKANALHCLNSLKLRSQNVVVESYLLNNVGMETKSKFLKAAKRALKPGGRLVLIQDRGSLIWIYREARNLKMRPKVFDFSDAELKASKSRAIRDRSSPRKRRGILNHYVKRGAKATLKKIELLLDLELISSKDEYTRPIMVVMQKPRKGQRRALKGKKK